MPIYEYLCPVCGRKNSLFKPTIAAAQAAEADGLRCEKCGADGLRRTVSSFTTAQTRPTDGEQLYDFDRATADLDD